MIILKSSFIILVPKKIGIISRMIDSSKKKKWFFRSRPGAANPSSHSHPLREPRKVKFVSTFSKNTSSHHHPCQQFRNRKNMSTHIRMTVQTESLESVLVARWAIGCEWNLRSMFVIVFDSTSHHGPRPQGSSYLHPSPYECQSCHPTIILTKIALGRQTVIIWVFLLSRQH